MFSKLIKTANSIMERMTPRQLLMAAAGAGVIMCLLIYATIHHIEQSIIAEQPEPVVTEKVVVAAQDIPRGAILTADMLKVEEFTEASIPDGYSDDVRVFVGCPAKLEIFAGDVITDQKVYSDIRQAGFIGMIPDDCRAMSIPIDDVTGVAGFLAPGNRVDVMLVTTNRGGVKAEAILQDVLLLGIGKNSDRGLLGRAESKAADEEGDTKSQNEVQTEAKRTAAKTQKLSQDMADQFAGRGFQSSGSIAARSGGGVAESSGTATLALRPADMLKVAAALQQGALQLALRPFKPREDSVLLASTEYQAAGTSGIAIPAAVPAASYQPPAAASRPVPTFQPPASPVAAGSRAASTSPGGYEVIRWGAGR